MRACIIENTGYSWSRLLPLSRSRYVKFGAKQNIFMNTLNKEYITSEIHSLYHQQYRHQ